MYKKTDLKITFRGNDLGSENIVYNTIHNEFIINTYKSVKSFKNEFMSLLKSRDIKYIHGYPSAVYSFLKDFEEITDEKEKVLLRSSIRACFLASEFPTPLIKQYLEGYWNMECLSWYGHSEMCILASDNENRNRYVPYNTYGYTEVVKDQLIGTSYYNFDMPLIRYDTGDKVSAKYTKEGLLKYFTITIGRVGDFILDNDGAKISLTALIFGRHHRAFDFVDFIQVKQDKESKLILFYLVSKKEIGIDQKLLMNTENLNINYEIKLIDVPFRTKAGKVNLKID